MPTQTNDAKTTLKSTKHSGIISKMLLSFYQDHELFDTIIIAGNESDRIQAHSVVLCSLSEYILDIFREKRLVDNIIELKEIEPSALKDVVDFLYTGTIQMSLDSAEEFLRIGVQLKIQTLIDCCSEFIERSIDSTNSLKWYRIAHELCLPSMKTKSSESIYLYFEKLSMADECLELSENVIKDLLFKDNPYGDFEEEVFFTMVDWIDYDRENREHLVLELLSLVRFWELTPKFIIQNRNKVCKIVECYELLCSWIEWHLSPETRSIVQKEKKIISLKSRIKLDVVSLVNNKIHIHTLNKKPNVWSLEKINELPSTNTVPINSMIKLDKQVIMFDLPPNPSDIKNINFCGFDMETSKNFTFNSVHNSYSQLVNVNGEICIFDIYKGIFHIFKHTLPDTWTKLTARKEVSGFAFPIAVQNRMIFLFDSTNTLHRFDISTNKWTLIPIPSIKINIKHLAVPEGNQEVYLFGDKVVKCFHFINKTCYDLDPIPDKLESNRKCYCFKNQIIMSDGQNFEKLNTVTGKWKTLPRLPVTQEIMAFDFTIKKNE